MNDHFYNNNKPLVLECLINGKRVHYDACGIESLEETKAYYEATQFKNYIGSGYVIYVDNVENRMSMLHHFFTR